VAAAGSVVYKRVVLEGLRTTLEPWIAPHPIDLLVLYNASSPQYKALHFLANDPFVLLSVNNNNQTLPTRILLERYVLLVLYYSTDGLNWHLPSWTLQGNACNWNNDPNWTQGFNSNALGVYCYLPGDPIGPEDSIQFLYFVQVGLSGTIPWEMSLLTNLEQLEFDNNLLRGTIPTQLSALTRLKSLWMASNFLTGPLPLDLPATVQSLDFRGNALTGTLPHQWGTTLPQLYWFSASKNQLTGTLPESWQALTDLEVMDLESNHLTGRIPTQYGKAWPQARSIFWESNDLTGTLPSELGGWTKLNNFWIGSNYLTGSIPTQLAQWTLLDTFSFSHNQFTGSVNHLFCINNETSWAFLQGDCLPNSKGQVEITCSCCTSCCAAAGSYCKSQSP
jgi:Leucine-rich repeat (LRR) protein